MHAMIRIWLFLAAIAFSAPLAAQPVSDRGYDPETILALKGLQLLDQRINAAARR